LSYTHNLSDPIVLKFGGASVANIEQFDVIAELILDARRSFKKVLVVISAMQGITDQLTQLAFSISKKPPKREMDMLLSVGERISMSLLAMALEKKGHSAVSFTGSQSGIITCGGHTEAYIIDVRPIRLKSHLDLGDIVIVAGFQGVSLEKEITTLGRGGSDTTAVALAASLGGKKVIFYKDVPGIFDRDPKIFADAKHLQKLEYRDALKLADQGAKILHPRSILLAEKNGVELDVRSFKEEGRTVVGQPVGAIEPTFEKALTPSQ
jgi:aspartate kinase